MLPLYSTNGSLNSYGYSNTAFDSLLTEGSEAPAVDDAIRKWQQAEDILAQDMPDIGFHSVGRGRPLAASVHDLPPVGPGWEGGNPFAASRALRPSTAGTIHSMDSVAPT